MVTDEERDYMWGEYAKDPRMKANIGIRRRLAPLLDNDTNTRRLPIIQALAAKDGVVIDHMDHEVRHLAAPAPPNEW